MSHWHYADFTFGGDKSRGWEFSSEGWWFGSRNEKSGNFPELCVEHRLYIEGYCDLRAHYNLYKHSRYKGQDLEVNAWR